MARFLLKRTEKLGTAPGTLQFVGTPRVDKVRIDLIQYDAEQVNVREDIGVSELDQAVREGNGINWVLVQGLQDYQLIEQVGRIFNLHELLLEDVLDTTQQPKYEEFENYLLVIARRLRTSSASGELDSEQLSMVVGGGFLLVFLESPPELLNSLKTRVQNPGSRLRQKGSFYLGYAVLDRMVDNYYRILAEIGEKVEALEDELLDSPRKEHLGRINDNKLEINYLRKQIRPMVEVIYMLSKTEIAFREKEMKPFFQDLKDHLSQTLNTLSSYKEMLENQMYTYQATVANRLNDIIMVLTIFSVIFIPLTFLAGVYGMNFEHMPELGYRQGYLYFWLAEFLIAGGMLFFFWRKGWL